PGDDLGDRPLLVQARDDDGDLESGLACHAPIEANKGRLGACKARDTLCRMRVSVVIVVYRSGDALARCLDSLTRETRVEAEVIVVDNGAAGDEVDEARLRPGVQVVGEGENLGFAAGSN